MQTKRKMLTKTCPVCGKKFETTKSNKKYCSQSCAYVGIQKIHNEYCKRYRETHKDKIRAIHQKYYMEHRKEICERQNEYRRKYGALINAHNRQKNAEKREREQEQAKRQLV